MVTTFHEARGQDFRGSVTGSNMILSAVTGAFMINYLGTAGFVAHHVKDFIFLADPVILKMDMSHTRVLPRFTNYVAQKCTIQ